MPTKPAKKPTLAVWKFASCDGCQLSLLDCEDELLAVAGRVEIANFVEASRAVVKGPYDLSLVEGSITTPHDAQRIQEIRRVSKHLITIGACATAGGIQALRNFKDVKEFVSIVYARPAYIQTLARSTAIADHVMVDFELRGCPIDKHQLLEVILAFLAGRKPNTPRHSVCIECKQQGKVCVMVAHGTPCLGPVTQAGCGALCPGCHRGCYGCFGPKETPNTIPLSAQWKRLGASEEELTRVYRTFNISAEAFRKEGTAMKDKTIKVDYLARVEGEGAIFVKIKGGKVADVKFRIFEPPRFFEAFLRGRMFSEAPDITARICGICPVAYQMSACHAMEDALGIKVGGQLRALRRLLYCGEWIESHALHVYMLHAPDFLCYQDGIRMGADHPDELKRGLGLKKAGNDIVRQIGGREIHPVNVRVGGFYRVPTRAELAPLAEKLKAARDAALETVRWVAGFSFPELEYDYEFVALRHPDEYPFNEGRLVSDKGLDIPIRDYDRNFVEEHVQHSNALHSTLIGRGPYLVGPQARYSLNFDKLSPLAQSAAREAGLERICKNPFKSIIIRSVELVYACDEALRIIDQYEPPDRPAVPISPQAGIGYACTEAPRGILYHRYRLDQRGQILDAKIVPPTSQNQKTIEDDLARFVNAHIDLPHEKLQWQCEQAVRNYDPCISCATHFLKLHVEREP